MVKWEAFCSEETLASGTLIWGRCARAGETQVSPPEGLRGPHGSHACARGLLPPVRNPRVSPALCVFCGLVLEEFG